MKQLMIARKPQQGFTLVELLIVIAIIGILAAVLTPQFINARKVAADRAAEAFVHEMAIAVDVYHVANNEYPTKDDVLALGIRRPKGLIVGVRPLHGEKGRAVLVCSTHSQGSGAWYAYFTGIGSAEFPSDDSKPKEILGDAPTFPNDDGLQNFFDTLWGTPIKTLCDEGVEIPYST